MNAPQKEVEVDLKEISCPYTAEDTRTLIWLEGYREGHRAGMDRGAAIVSQAYNSAIARVAS